jgi:ABC-type tungstate transport system substrate-binding protein
VHNGRSGSSVLFLADQMVLLLSIVKRAADSGYYVGLCDCVVQFNNPRIDDCFVVVRIALYQGMRKVAEWKFGCSYVVIIGYGHCFEEQSTTSVILDGSLRGDTQVSSQETSSTILGGATQPFFNT